MNRRQFLTGGAASVPVLLAGCLTSSQSDSGPGNGCTGEWAPTVDADEPTLSPGEDTTLRVAVTGVHGLQLRLPIHDDEDPLEFGDESITPAPDRTADMSPPIWNWEDCSDVTVTVPVQALPGAEPAEIGYTVHLVQSLDGSGESLDRGYSITVNGD